MKPKISIIVPIYNSEEYLEQAIQSLLEQTISELEIILVNDGSIDESLAIANKYKVLDSRIKVISQANQGVSVARNYGLSVAQGEYVAFIDSDDYVDKEMYEILCNKADIYQLDLVISDFEQELDGKKVVDNLDIISNNVIAKKEIIEDIMPQFICHEKLNTVCNKLYRKSIIETYNISFPKGVTLGEDRLFNINYFMNIENLMYIDYCGYHYREVHGSATRNILQKDYFSRALSIYKENLPFECYEILDKNYIEELKVEKFINSIISYMHIYSNPQSGMPFIARYNYMRRMIEHPDVIAGIKIYFNKFYRDKTLYEKIFIRFIKIRFLPGVQLLVMYSRLRCK